MEEYDKWWDLPLSESQDKPNKVKIEIVLDIELFDKLKGKDINEYLTTLIKNDLIINE